MNTKARHDEIAAVAAAILDQNGVDVTRQIRILDLAEQVAKSANCHIDTAKKHVARAVRLRRGAMSDAERSWGGPRPGAGRGRGLLRSVELSEASARSLAVLVAADQTGASAPAIVDRLIEEAWRRLDAEYQEGRGKLMRKVEES